MEQLRVFLEVVKKYHFWILCGLIVLITFGTWYMATSDRAAAFVTRKGKIEGSFSAIAKVSSNNDQPSHEYIEKIHDREKGGPTLGADKSLLSNVNDGWTRLYHEQRADNPLPRISEDETVQAGFQEAFEKAWAPMEEIEKNEAEFKRDKLLVELYRTAYQNHIKETFPKLFEMIERRTEVENKDQPGGNQHGPMMGFGGKPGDDKVKQFVGIVDWADADKIKERFTRWSGTPTTLQIMLAQEDLWVYETLLKVIRYTNNTGADRPHYGKPANHRVARIKEILALEIGNDAVQSWTVSENSVVNIPVETSGDTKVGVTASQGPTAASGRGQAADSYLSSRASSGGTTVSPLIGRYVDNYGKPLADPTKQPNEEFRMMPIDMKIIIEQKEIPRLLVECANSSMRIDVRSVRILVQKPRPFDLNSRDASTATSGDTGSRNGDMSMGGRRTGGEVGGRDESGEYKYTEESADPIYPPVPVEIQGVIYIYNPPTTVVQSTTAGEGGAPAAPPAAGSGTAPAGTPPAGTAPTGTGAAATGSASSAAPPAVPGESPQPGGTAPVSPAAPAPTSPATPAGPSTTKPAVPSTTNPSK